MACTAEKLFQLEFVVKTLSRCGRPEDSGCPTIVAIRICDHPEQTVCEIPAGRPGGACAATTVDQGKTFTFSMPGGAGGAGGRSSCSPRPVRVTVRLYRAMGTSRVELAAGDLELTPRECPDRGGCRVDEEQSVAMTDCPGGRTVAVLMVKARAWAAGTVTAGPVEPPPCPARGCGGSVASPCDSCPKKRTPCCGAPTCEPPRRPCQCIVCIRRL